MKVGFALLELMMVLTIAAIVILFSINQYRTYQQEQTLIAISQNVKTLYQALNDYYQENCQTGESFNPTLKDLPEAITNHLIHTPIVTDYQVTAYKLSKTKQSHKDIYQLIVTATLNIPSTLLNWYQQKLQATSILEGNRLKWVYMPSYPVNTTDSGLWILNATLRNYKEQTLKENKD